MTIPAVMKAAVTFRHGGPEATEIIPDWPLPPPGPGQAVVRVTAAAVNNTDLWSRAGAYGTAHDPAAVVGWLGVPLTFPLIQGADIAGVVASVGAGVNPSMVGRRVIVDPALAYDGEFPTAVVGSEAHGGFAEYHLTDAIHIHDVDGSPLTDTQLACLPIAYGTAMAMIDRAECRALERVLVTGASGGVGLAAVQILSALGCTVVGYTSADNVEVVESAGAREIIRRGVDDLGSMPEVDAVVDVVGGDTFGEVIDRLRSGGRLVSPNSPVREFCHLWLRLPILSTGFTKRRLGSNRRTSSASSSSSPDLASAKDIVGACRQTHEQRPGHDRLTRQRSLDTSY